MTTPALIAYTVSAVAWAIAIGMVALPYLLGSPERRFSRPLAGKSPEKHSADLEETDAAVAPAAARYDDTSLSGLARHEAADWGNWTRRHPEGPDNDQDPEKPWRPERPLPTGLSSSRPWR